MLRTIPSMKKILYGKKVYVDQHPYKALKLSLVLWWFLVDGTAIVTFHFAFALGHLSSPHTSKRTPATL